MFLAGKQPGRPLGATTRHGPQGSCVFYVSHKVTGCRYLVDTEAVIIEVPATRLDRFCTPSYYPQAVNSTRISVYKKRSISLDLCLKRTFPWLLLVADVSQALVGADFLQHRGLLADVKRGIRA